MSRKIRIEEYVPAATFVLASFVRDRAELESRFSEFTTDFQAEFEQKLEEIKQLEQALKLTEKQKQLTQALYLQADELNRELNFLVYYFERAGLDAGIISPIKRKLTHRNIEGACFKLSGLIAYVTEQQVLLQEKGMDAGFLALLDAGKKGLEEKNAGQNAIRNALLQLHSGNRGEYEVLFDFMRTVAKAGKILYNGEVRHNEYTIEQVLGRLRGGASAHKEKG